MAVTKAQRSGHLADTVPVVAWRSAPTEGSVLIAFGLVVSVGQGADRPRDDGGPGSDGRGVGAEDKRGIFEIRAES